MHTFSKNYAASFEKYFAHCYVAIFLQLRSNREKFSSQAFIIIGIESKYVERDHLQHIFLIYHDIILHTGQANERLILRFFGFRVKIIWKTDQTSCFPNLRWNNLSAFLIPVNSTLQADFYFKFEKSGCKAFVGSPCTVLM